MSRNASASRPTDCRSGPGRERRLVQTDERDRVLFATSACSSVGGSRFRIPTTVLASAIVREAGKGRR